MALRGGISKVNFEQSLSTFGNTCPQNGSKNEPRAPRTSLGYPHIGLFVVRNRLTRKTRRLGRRRPSEHYQKQTRPDMKMSRPSSDIRASPPRTTTGGLGCFAYTIARRIPGKHRWCGDETGSSGSCSAFLVVKMSCPCPNISGGGTTRAEDAQGTPTKSHISPSILVYKDQIFEVSRRVYPW